MSLHLTVECRDVRKGLKARHQKKIEELSEIQQKPLRRVTDTVKVPEDVKVPDYVIEVLSFGPKQPTKGKFDEMSFLAGFDHCLTELGDADADAINELNAAAIWYRTRAKKDKGSRTVDRAKMFKEKWLKSSTL